MINRSIKVVGLEHKRIAGAENLFCAWPWTGGIHNFENGEVVIAYTEMPSAYKTLDDVRHREDEARLVLCRTLDGGETWPEKLRSVLYISGDQGLNWYLLSIIAYEKTGDFGCAYPALLLLPGGRLLCTVGYRATRSYSGISTSWTSLTYSDDGGRTWAEPRRINSLGDQAKLYRLGDGRIVCMYGYRFVPFGIRGIVSEDEGNTWSDEFVIRDDGAGIDLGYPALTQLPDGRILTVYYFNVEDGIDTRTLSGGRRFIAASTFRLE